MANDDPDLNQETPEQLVARIREYLREADQIRSTQPKRAEGLELRATELIRLLTESQLPKIKSLAKNMLGTAFELHEEGMVEIILELDRVVRLYDTRKGLETCFSTTFWSIASDGINKARASNRRISGVRAGSVPVDSADATTESEEGKVLDSALESIEDSSGIDALEAVIDRAQVRELLNRLPEVQRKVLILRMEGHEFSEIAGQLGIHRETASSHFTKATTTITNQIALQQRVG